MRLVLLLALIVSLAAVSSGSAARSAPSGRTVLLGVLGNPDHFESTTGQKSRVRHVIMGFGQNTGPRLDRMLQSMGEIPLLAFSMRGYTARDIARGAGDAFLVDLNRAVAAWPGRIYIRPFGEMNGHWNDYCAFNRDGSSRGPARSTASFRKAFARVHLIVHGAPNANARLRGLGLPPVRGTLTPAPFPRVRIIWNPQGYGSPNVPGNSAQAYYPGDAYVDVVANDLYNIGGKAEWTAADALYRAHPAKPYAFGEWANWGIDDAGFVKRMAEFVRTHPRTELISYYQGNRGSIFDLATKPKSRAAYRQLIVPLAR
jgi:hypothetical protein